MRGGRYGTRCNNSGLGDDGDGRSVDSVIGDVVNGTGGGYLNGGGDRGNDVGSLGDSDLAAAVGRRAGGRRRLTAGLGGYGATVYGLVEFAWQSIVKRPIDPARKAPGHETCRPKSWLAITL